MKLDPRVALITGASSGIGAALAREFARNNWSVGLIARRKDKLIELTEALRQSGAIAEYIEADVAQIESLQQAVAQLREKLGPIDLMIANAGIGIPTRIEPFNRMEIESTFQINTLGVVYAFDAVLPEMLQRQSGQLVAISSLAGFQGLPGESAYCASKAAVNVFLEGLRMQLRGRGIAVTCVCPGFVKTPMTDKDPYPQPFQMSAEKAATIIYRGIQKKKKVLRFPWQTSLMMRMVRWLPDWLVIKLVEH